MCDFIITPLLAAAGGATAAGATAAATTATAGAFSGLQLAGLALTAGGSLLQGMQGARAAAAQEQALAAQRETETRLAQTEATRTRAQFRTQIGRQTAELASRGVSLDSPTALLLGQAAGREMSFADQAIRAGAQARDIELSAAQATARARRTSSLLTGAADAAGAFLTRAPDIWPELLQ